MVEPTESESLDELQRFVDAMDKIRREIYTIPEIVKNAPHTQSEICGEWVHAYTQGRRQCSLINPNTSSGLQSQGLITCLVIEI